jgi:Protein of unknown function (DUF2934)
MARKSEGTPRKSTSPRKTAAKQPNPVTPIRESNVVVAENGASQIHPGIEEEIRTRAYELYLERGGLDGFDQEDWRQAEMEILSKYNTEKSA